MFSQTLIGLKTLNSAIPSPNMDNILYLAIALSRASR